MLNFFCAHIRHELQQRGRRAPLGRLARALGRRRGREAPLGRLRGREAPLGRRRGREAPLE